MKRTFLFVLFALCCVVMIAQQMPITAVTLKNGTVLKGVIRHIDPTDALTINISGLDTNIKMSDVASIETLSAAESHPQFVRQKMVAPDTLQNFKGFLLAKGNNVYIYSGASDIEKAGAEILRQLLKKRWILECRRL